MLFLQPCFKPVCTLVATLENNRCRRFIFNDLAWESASVFSDYNDLSKPVERHFDVDLTVEEINLWVKREW